MSIDTVTWNALFSVINLIQSAMLLYNERPVRLHPMEEEIYIRVFRSRKIPLSRRDFKSLAKKAMVLDYHEGEAYLQQGETVETVGLVMCGSIHVYTNFEGDNRFAKININEAWDWVDSPQFLTSINGTDSTPKSAVSLIASGPTQLCVWTLDDIRELCGANPQLSVCLLSVLAHDCAMKILKTEKYLLSSETIRSAAHELLQEADLRRRADSISKLPITAKQRMIGVDHTSVDLDVPTDSIVVASRKNASSASVTSSKSARRLNAPSSSTLAIAVTPPPVASDANQSRSSLTSPAAPAAPATITEKKARKKKKTKLTSANNETELDNLDPQPRSASQTDSNFSRAMSHPDTTDSAAKAKKKKSKGTTASAPIVVPAVDRIDDESSSSTSSSDFASAPLTPSTSETSVPRSAKIGRMLHNDERAVLQPSGSPVIEDENEPASEPPKKSKTAKKPEQPPPSESSSLSSSDSS